jgi:hypothetical protein
MAKVLQTILFKKYWEQNTKVKSKIFSSLCYVGKILFAILSQFEKNGFCKICLGIDTSEF